MSKLNKVNKGNYVQAGRLTPDEMARERGKQDQAGGRANETVTERSTPGRPDAPVASRHPAANEE